MPAEVSYFGWWSWIIANDRGNRTTLSLSPTRTSTEFGLAGISCFPRVKQTSQWTWLIASLPLLQDVVCLLPHTSQWNLPDTVEPAIEKSQKNIVLNLICMLAWFKKEWYNRFDFGVPEICLSNLNPRILLTANPFTVNSYQQCFSHFFPFLSVSH